MQKVSIIMLFSLLVFSCAEAPEVKKVPAPESPDAPVAPVAPSEEPLIPFNEQELGYKTTISLIDNGNGNYTYDYTGLGINDDYQAELTASYFLDNLTSTIESYTAILFKGKSALWVIDSKSYGSVNDNYYKQNFNVANVSPNITRVSIIIKHKTLVNELLSENSYIYKGLNNGSGEMELVGKMIKNRDGITTEGDTSPLEPYNP